MKKKNHAYLLGLCVIVLMGCGKPTANTQTQQCSVNRQQKNNNYMSRIYFDRHYYVKYEIGDRFPAISIIHDPDCPCREKGGENE